jgi:hypothetical protein
MEQLVRFFTAFFMPAPKVEPLSRELKEHVARVAALHAQSGAAPVHDGVDPQLSDESLAKAGLGPQSTVWYFAFGSNLSPEVFEKRRRIDPIQTYPAMVKGFTLSFNLPGFPLVEPSFANLAACPHEGACDACFVHGVMYRITHQQLQHLHASEGGPSNYQMHEVEARPYVLQHDSTMVHGLAVKASTLIAPNSRVLSGAEVRANPPSQRYVNILVRPPPRPPHAVRQP